MKIKNHRLLPIFLIFIITFTTIPVEAFSHIEKINKGPLIAMPIPVTVMNEEEVPKTMGESEEVNVDATEENEEVSRDTSDEAGGSEASQDSFNEDQADLNSEEIELKEPEKYYDEEQIDGEIVAIDEDSIT